MEVRCNVEGDLQLQTLALPDGRQVSEIRLEHIPENVKDAVITVEWNFPILDIAGRWHPTCRFDRRRGKAKNQFGMLFFCSEKHGKIK